MLTIGWVSFTCHGPRRGCLAPPPGGGDHVVVRPAPPPRQTVAPAGSGYSEHSRHSRYSKHKRAVYKQ
eukprot:350104-Prorocentrum_minimum.AAC.1